MKKILIIDDHEILAEALAAYINLVMPDVEVKAVSSLAEAKRIPYPIDLVLLDLHMPDRLALESLSKVIEQFSPARVAIFSGDLNPDTVRNCLQQGAAGFVPKTYKHQALKSAIDLLLSGESFIPSIALVPPTPLIVASAEFLLSARERQIADLLCLGLSNKEIARETGLTDGTIKQYMRSLFRHLEVHSRTQAVRKLLLTRGGETNDLVDTSPGP